MRDGKPLPYVVRHQRAQPLPTSLRCHGGSWKPIWKDAYHDRSGACYRRIDGQRRSCRGSPARRERTGNPTLGPGRGLADPGGDLQRFDPLAVVSLEQLTYRDIGVRDGDAHSPLTAVPTHIHRPVQPRGQTTASRDARAPMPPIPRQTCVQAVGHVDTTMHWYNHQRIKQSLDWKSPVQYRKQQGLAA
jgi:hypothetical protein